ncbi:WD repeat-containing protein 74-like [Anopheles albimanus]|uniref:WD repeat-containing protein 74 n=1 Tax=Anopheles albimanus TaxID=7167 RepID=A0A182FKB2_ANOAL|nr:WD repeat-containing protein 74-like [Anopheles albimanus]
MKFASINAKCPTYNEQQVIYVGAHTGSFKRIHVFDDNPYEQKNLQPIETLTKTSKVTCMEFGNAEQTEILVGRTNHFVKVFNTIDEESTSNFEAGKDEVVGLGRCDECIVVGSANGIVQIVKYPTPVEFSVGENLARMRLCPQDSKRMVTGGKLLKQIIKLWDLETQAVLFSAKNVRKDMLELEQPVWENDVVFVDRNLIASCSRHGYVRLYDTRGPQKRPIQGYTSNDPDDQLSFSCLASHGDYLYAGTTTFGARAFDIRKMKNHIHVYKGFTGTVSSIRVDPTGNHLVTGCLDRYVRVHHAHRTALEYRCYVKSKPTQVLIADYKERKVLAKNSTDDDEVEVVQEAAGSDAEYDELFSKMQTVNERSAGTNKRKADEENGSAKVVANGGKTSLSQKKKKIAKNK